MLPPNETRTDRRRLGRRLRAVVVSLGSYAALGGLVSFLGWVLDRPAWTDWTGLGISIQPNASICSWAGGSALALLACGHRRIAAALALIVFVLGALTIVQHATGFDFGIDAPLSFGRSWGQKGATMPGRMGPPGSTAWTAIGAGIALAALGRGRARRVASWLAVFAASIATFSLVGYLFRADPFYTLPRATSIALQTATMVLAVGLGLVMTIEEHGPMRRVLEPGAAGMLIRRSLPFVLIVPILIGLMRAYAQDAGWFDPGTGRALLAIAQVVLLLVLLSWGAAAVRRHERSLTEALIANRRGEELHRRQSSFLEKLVGACPLPIAVVEGDELRFTLVNPAYAALEGRGPPEVGRTCLEVFPELAELGADERLREVIRSGEPWRIDEVEVSIAGLKTWWEGEVISLGDIGPRPSALIIAWEVSDRVRSERLLRKQRSLLQTLTTHARVGLVIVDRERRYLYANSAYAEILGLALPDIVGHPVAEVPGSAYAQVRPRLEQAFAGERVEYELELSGDAGGDPRVLAVTYEPQLEQESVHSVVVVVVDVSERRHAERERERLLERERAARADVERAARLKDEFLATLSHELRTPLNAILGWSQVLDAQRGDRRDLAFGLEVIERNARLQAQLIADLLDLSRIISGKMRLDVRPIRLEEIVDAAIETIRPAADAKQVVVRRIVGPGPGPVQADPGRLQQVVWNLLSNAVKFSTRGGHVEVELARRDAMIEIRVADTGDGIDPQFLPHVFERFRQGDASFARTHGGLGIGLAIVKQLVELHGGTVDVASDGKGRGSSFVVRLPLFASSGGLETSSGPIEARPVVAAPGPRPAGGANAAVEEPDGLRPLLEGQRVLVVDDQLDACMLVQRMLSESGALVELAASCDEALEQLDGASFDLLVSDIGMPQRDGYDLIRELRQRGSRIPAIALTAYAHAEDRMRALSAGFQAHVAKPVDTAEMLATAAALLRRQGRAGA